MGGAPGHFQQPFIPMRDRAQQDVAARWAPIPLPACLGHVRSSLLLRLGEKVQPCGVRLGLPRDAVVDCSVQVAESEQDVVVAGGAR